MQENFLIECCQLDKNIFFCGSYKILALDKRINQQRAFEHHGTAKHLFIHCGTIYYEVHFTKNKSIAKKKDFLDLGDNQNQIQNSDVPWVEVKFWTSLCVLIL